MLMAYATAPVSRQELEDLFADYGKIIDTKIMNGFGFVEFGDSADAKDAVPAFHGTTFKGERLTVQFARGPRIDTREFVPRRPNPRRTSFRMQITGLAEGTSWQDLKDFARTAGVDVVYTEVDHYTDGVGIVEFETVEDLDTAIEKLDGTEYRGSVVSCTQDDSDSVAPACSPKQPHQHLRGRSPPPYRCYHGHSQPPDRYYSSRGAAFPRGRYRERSPHTYHHHDREREREREREYSHGSPPPPPPRVYTKSHHAGGFDDGYRSRGGLAASTSASASASARNYDHGYRGRSYARARSPHDGYEREYRGEHRARW
ncbi:hypothetical protein KEM52_003077 [Ascosphaera acerosa]|nr:hypothetical protein KEM52_003077 [Ascosphaera acerosa]